MRRDWYVVVFSDEFLTIIYSGIFDIRHFFLPMPLTATICVTR